MFSMHNPSNEIGVTVAEMAASELETPIKEMPPLGERIDTDALEGLVSSVATEPPSNLNVTFSYANTWVQIRSGRTVYVSPSRDDGASEGPFGSMR